MPAPTLVRPAYIHISVILRAVAVTFPFPLTRHVITLHLSHIFARSKEGYASPWKQNSVSQLR